MVAKLTVIFFIILSLQIGFILTLLPWINNELLGEWGGNYLLVSVSNLAGLPAIQQTVSSGWVRGAVTGLGVLNILIAFWEIINFNASVRLLEGEESTKSSEK